MRVTSLTRLMSLRMLSVIVALLIPSVVSAQLPRPTNPNLTRLGYYFVDERYGDDTATVWPYTNLYVAMATAYDSANPDWQTPFTANLQKATVNHKAIYLLLGPDTLDDAILDIAQNYWGQIAYVEVVHEPPANFTWQQMEARIQAVHAKVLARGLPGRPYGTTMGDAVLTTNAITAPSLSFVNIEAYVAPPGDPNPQVNVNYLNSFLATAKSRVHNAGKGIFLTMQAYDRNGLWTNMTTLEAIQRPVYLNAYADPDVWGILMFAFNRPGGAKDHPQLQQAHREIGSVMGISPAMNIDAPGNGATVTQPFAIGGWAIDRAAFPGAGTGVDTLHVWAYPAAGGAPTFLGVPGYSGYRPDVGAVYGAQFTNSGFGLIVSSLPAGSYWVVVYTHSAVSGMLVKEQVVFLNIQ